MIYADHSTTADGAILYYFNTSVGREVIIVVHVLLEVTVTLVGDIFMVSTALSAHVCHFSTLTSICRRTGFSSSGVVVGNRYFFHPH